MDGGEPATNPQSNQETSSTAPIKVATEEEAKVPQSANANEQKEKRHRRSKNDPIGRKYICDLCSKSYLSAPALSSHRKTKHFQNEEKKGRGRPRKYVSVLY